jgi:ribosome-associated protein
LSSDIEPQDHEASQRLSKTKQKKSAHDAQRVGEALCALNDTKLNAIQMPAELREAVVAARNMRQHGARRRQMQYIGALMRSVDVAALQTEIDSANAEGHEERRRFKQVELWRDELAAGDENRLAWLEETFPNLERERLRRLIDAVSRSNAETERRKAGKALFRYLRKLVS